MNTPSDKPSPENLPATNPFAHLTIGSAPDVERLKAEFRAKMNESGKQWPRKRAKKRRR